MGIPSKNAIECFSARSDEVEQQLFDSATRRLCDIDDLNWEKAGRSWWLGGSISFHVSAHALGACRVISLPNTVMHHLVVGTNNIVCRCWFAASHSTMPIVLLIGKCNDWSGSAHIL